MRISAVKKLFVGSPLATAQARHERPHLLHNQTALLIKGALLFRKGVVVVDVPFHLQ